jgi:hypothetical protein
MPPKERKRKIQEQVKTVSDCRQLFFPANGLPVVIDYTDRANPYWLATDVTYTNEIVRIVMPRGEKWDGCSIPVWWVLLPWIVSLVAFCLTPYAWLVAAVLIAYVFRLLPYMQKMGLHARAACVHDHLYRKQPVARVVADAIMLSIMEKDRVPWDVRNLIYGRLRWWGGFAWRKNAKDLEIIRATER